MLPDEGNVAERREVALGPLHDGRRIVRSGLEAEDRVIVSGSQFVMAGAEVSPQKPDATRLAEAR